MGKQDRINYGNQLTSDTRAIYDAIGKVYCPALKEDVYFTAHGFHHLAYEANGTPRTVNERIYKLRLFPLAIPAIKNTTAIREI